MVLADLSEDIYLRSNINTSKPGTIGPAISFVFYVIGIFFPGNFMSLIFITIYTNTYVFPFLFSYPSRAGYLVYHAAFYHGPRRSPT